MTARSLALLLLLSGGAAAQPARPDPARPDPARPDPARVAKRLAALRAETSRLDDELRAMRAESLAELRGLAEQKAALSARLASEQGRLAEAQTQIDAARAQDAQRVTKAEQVHAMVAQALLEIRAAVADTLPFRRPERLAALDDLSAALAGGRLSAVEVAARLWRFAEDELRLTAEIAETTAPITVADGEVRLLRALRVGMLMLYTLDSKGEFGALLRTDGVWRWRAVADVAIAAELNRLFADRAHKLHTGVYRLPIPTLAEVVP
jgi:hypothetical protein